MTELDRRPDTYVEIARWALDVVRSHVTPLIPRAKVFAFELGFVALVVAVTLPIGIEIGAYRANLRHVESLRVAVPALEEALAAHRSELRALTDTVEALDGVRLVEP